MTHCKKSSNLNNFTKLKKKLVKKLNSIDDIFDCKNITLFVTIYWVKKTQFSLIQKKKKY